LQAARADKRKGKRGGDEEFIDASKTLSVSAPKPEAAPVTMAAAGDAGARPAEAAAAPQPAPAEAAAAPKSAAKRQRRLQDGAVDLLQSGAVQEELIKCACARARCPPPLRAC
jgi:hypothetical protein